MDSQRARNKSQCPCNAGSQIKDLCVKPRLYLPQKDTNSVNSELKANPIFKGNLPILASAPAGESVKIIRKNRFKVFEQKQV